jgi:hypothetical protein
MQYTYDAKAFAKDLQAFMDSIDCDAKTAANVTGVGYAGVRRVLRNGGCFASTLAILCYWANLDVRKYVIDQPGQGSRPVQRAFRFGLVTPSGRVVPARRK